VGRKVYEKYGNIFPLLIKFIDAHDDLSIQVHPDDKLANERHRSFGKTEMWYVIKAVPGAFLYSGFQKRITPEIYVETVKNNTFTDTLKRYEVKEGDVFFCLRGAYTPLAPDALSRRFSRHPISPTAFTTITEKMLPAIPGNCIQNWPKTQSTIMYMIHVR